MAHLFQVGVGSGGMPVLDMLARDQRITRVTLVEPDVYKPHNVVRHLFPLSAVGRLKADLAAEWLAQRCPHLDVQVMPVDLLAAEHQPAIEAAVADCDIGVCAADNELAKFHFDALMRRHRKPWTLGEVLSGGIGGWVHWFVPDGPCYGCVASHLQRDAPPQEVAAPAPDYSTPEHPIEETTIPASRSAIQAIAGLHALITQQLLDNPRHYQPGFSSLLMTLQAVPDVFDEAFRPYRLRIARSADCLICRPQPPEGPAIASEDLDVALDQALARLGNA